MNRHWGIRLGDVVEIKGGGTPSTSNPAFWNGDIPWVSPKDMKSWSISDAEDKITEEAIRGSATNLVPEGSILVVNRSGILKRTLPVGVARRPVAINQDIKALICGPMAHPDYIAHIVKAAEQTVLGWVRATTADNFPVESLRGLEIPLPPLDEQRRIAAILDKADALRQKRKRAIALLDSLTQSIFLEMFGEPESNPFGWSEVSFGDLILVGPTNGLYRPAGEYGSGTPIVRIDAFYDGVITGLSSLKRLRIDTKTQSSFALQQGDIVINRVNSLEYLGKSALVPALSEPTVFESNMMRIRVDNTRVTPGFCVALLQMDWIKKQIARAAKKAVNQASINQTDVRSLSMFLPPLTRQVEFDAAIAQIGSMKDRISLDQLDDLFAALQHRAFSGQL